MNLDGLVLVNRDFGYCKITAHTGNNVRVRFIGTGRDAWYGVQVVAAQKDFRWQPMPVGLKCRVADEEGVERGVCTVIESPFEPSGPQGLHEYVVRFDDAAGNTARLTERDLWPIPGSLAATPQTQLANLQADGLSSFRARARLQLAFEQLDRESAGIRALAASRIALLPHQAFVVGTVVDDPVWRYILADEVGLGKTIEAGAIAHQLLSQQPDARILVLCPGSLTRQWLCEMHLCFGGRDFHLLDLYAAGAVSFKKWPLLISSLKRAAREHRHQMLASAWDLVIVDEAHQLLWNAVDYDLVEQLAVKVPRLLLLSAIPARERDQELLRLLRLIDPERYREGTPVAAQFSALYASQSVIGRRLRIVSRQLDRPVDLDLKQLAQDVSRLISLEVLRDDPDLLRIDETARQAGEPIQRIEAYRQLTDAIVARYRISRRILKNRRARLVDAELLITVPRALELVTYEPSGLEQRIETQWMELLHASAEDADADTLQMLFRKTAQSLSDPVALYGIAHVLNTAEEDGPDHEMLLDSSAALDYDVHDQILEACASAVRPQLDAARLSECLALLRAAIEIPEHQRMKALKACLASLLGSGSRKLLVFAGTYGAAEYVVEALCQAFGEKAIASFRHDQGDDEKEREVARFRRDATCSILVSDESGGEGRNFQFADALVHFDLPWSVSAVEQRVGRLDRIGRALPVRSYVVCPTGGIEAAWARCLDQGFGVFTRSISGLEFMLRATEREVVDAAIQGGAPLIEDRIEAIREASARERASDDAEALTDEASFRSTRRYLRTADSEADAQLEDALPTYLRAIGRPEAARQITDRSDVNLKIWRLRPEDVTDYKLVGLEREGSNPLKECFGTFSRPVARERHDLEFFSIGHPLVDALNLAVRDHLRGRALLLRLPAGDRSPGMLLLSAWRVSLRPTDSALVVPEPAARLMSMRTVWAGLDLETSKTIDAPTLSHLTTQLLDKDSHMADLRREQAIETLASPQTAWSDDLHQLLDRARDEATGQYRARYRDADQAFCDQLLAEARTVARTRIDEGDAYAQAVAFTIGAVQSAQLELDVACLLQLEPGRSA